MVNYSEGEVGHAIRELEAMNLVREEWGARAPKYEHLANKGLNLHSKGIALPRQPGQKEGRYAHLLSGEPDIPAPVVTAKPAAQSTGLEERVAELEAELDEIRSRLDAIEEGMN